MKKRAFLGVIAAVASLTVLAGCGKKSDKLVIGASPTPHAEILAEVKDELAKEGVEIEIKEYTDYVIPNKELSDKALDANFFQHQPYLDNYNTENKTDIVGLAKIHFEPLGIYPGKVKSLEELKEGSKIGVPNDTTNEARALLLLQANGVIKLKDGAGLTATKNDIAENPKNVEIVELSAEAVARAIGDFDVAVLNGNNALLAGLSVGKDAIAKEDAASEAAQTYGNIIAVRAGDEKREDIQKLIDALHSEGVQKFINEKYDGAVVPLN